MLSFAWKRRPAFWMRARIRSATGVEDSAPEAPAPSPQTNLTRLRRLLRFFDAEGRLQRFPAKVSEQEACLWVVWAAMPAQRVLDDRETRAFLDARHTFGDHALLRRALCDFGFASRSRDGRAYRRIERKPPPDAQALIHYARRGAQAPSNAAAFGAK